MLTYSGILNVTVNSEEISYRPESDSDALCFAVNLCERKMSPLYISIPKDTNEVISDLEFMKVFKHNNWKIDFSSISVSNAIIPAQEQAMQEFYWNGVEDVAVSLDSLNMVLSNQIYYSSVMKDFSIHFSFTGKMYLLNDELEMV